ncbi:MAG: hypothetical protein A2W00_07300, partial [Candidatus Eisenbacteria bacterium RBG_16_71_46]
QWGTNGTGPGQFAYPYGIALDAAGNVYVADRNNYRVQKFSAAPATLPQAPASFLLKWGTTGGAIGELSDPAGIGFDGFGNILVADVNNHRIQKFTSSGAYLVLWGGAPPGPLPGQFDRPTGVVTDATTDVYVVDSGNHRIQKFASDGPSSYITNWGGLGTGDGKFNSPHGIAVNAANEIYVADLGNHRIQKFTSGGTFLLKWGANGGDGTPGGGSGAFNSPSAVAVDLSGNVYVADTGNNRVQKFTANGDYIGQWGSSGTGDGQFDAPTGIAMDAAGNVYVADGANLRIQKFTGSGTFLAKWNSKVGGGAGASTVLGIAGDATGNVYASFNGDRIEKYVAPPSIALVSDVGNDQGRSARLRIMRSSADAPDIGTPVTGYEVYRRNDPLPGAARAIEASAGENPQLAGWNYLMTIPAHTESEYEVVAPTLADGNASAFNFSAFMVRATTASPSIFYDSGVEYGFSLDNLAPPMPGNFNGVYVAQQQAIALHWDVSGASDFATFRLYRGYTVDFAPGPGSFVLATPDTGYLDPGPDGRYYKLTAVDRNDNESPFATFTPNQTVDVEGPGAGSLAFGLEPLRPNPMRGDAMVVHFTLPQAAPARIELLDVAGRRMAAREVGSLGVGRHSVNLAEGRHLAPGIYMVLITQGAERHVRRAVVLN